MPAGVTDHAWIGLAALNPFEVAVLLSDPVFESRRAFAGIVTDIVFDRRPALFHAVDDRLECCIVEHDPVFGVIDDIFELVVEQARIDCMEHPAHPCDAIPADQVPRVVHRHAGNPVALLDTQRLQMPAPFSTRRRECQPNLVRVSLPSAQRRDNLTIWPASRAA